MWPTYTLQYTEKTDRNYLFRISTGISPGLPYPDVLERNITSPTEQPVIRVSGRETRRKLVTQLKRKSDIYTYVGYLLVQLINFTLLLLMYRLIYCKYDYTTNY